MTDGTRILTVPRHNPVNAITMGNLVRDAGLSNDEFRKLVYRTSPNILKLSETWIDRDDNSLESLIGLDQDACDRSSVFQTGQREIRIVVATEPVIQEQEPG